LQFTGNTLAILKPGYPLGTKMLRRVRFGLKTLLVLIAVFAVYLAWRIHDPEAQAISAIHKAGGKTYYGYQEPWMGSFKATSVGQLPDHVYFSQMDIVCSGTQTPPKPTLAEFLLGAATERRVTAVELPIGQVTPELEEELQSLPELRILVIEMPAMVASADSADVKRLGELKEQFGDKVWPTVGLGL
jgi:hypothetical protein